MISHHSTHCNTDNMQNVAGCCVVAVQAVMMLCVQELNKRWRSLQQLAEERSNMLGSAHEVQRFHR